MALQELFAADRATTVVFLGGTDAPVSGTQETWTVASSAMFGTAQTGVSQFHVTDPVAPSEMIAVINVSGTTWTVTRGADSTTPVPHAAGFTVYQTVTAGFLAALGSGSGTVTSVAVESANGLAGTVADSTTTPQITLSTTVSGLLKGNGTAISAATAGTDYLTPSGSGAALTGITATQVGADASGAAATAQSNAETYAAAQAAAAQAAAEAASVPLSDLPLSIANGGTGHVTAAAAYNALSPMTTTGDIEIESSAGTAGRLAVGSASGPAGDFLGVSGGVPAWQQVSGQYLCAPSVYAPASETAPNTSSSTMAAVSSSNINTGSFTAPPSGSVVVSAFFAAAIATSGDIAVFGLAAHGTTSPIVANEASFKLPTSPTPCALSFIVTGLTAGNSYNFDLMYASPAGVAQTVYAFGQAATSPSASSVGAPVIMTVRAI